MQLVRLIYVSRMTEACDTAALQDILVAARGKNKLMQVTGVLCYDPAFFLQCLEGPRENINALYTTIARDPRHTDVTLLEYADAKGREFGDWSMAFLNAADIDKRTLKKYSGRGRFDPYKLTSAQAREFLIEIVRQKRNSLLDQV